MTEVRCSVDTCVFWGKGDICTADAIWVKNNMAGDVDDELNFGVEFGDEAGFAEEAGGKESKRTSAFTSSQTCCETMRPKSGEGGERKHGRRRGC